MFHRVIKTVVNVQCQSFHKYYSTGKTEVVCHGFTYYKRFPDEEDPPWEKTKLFMIKRVKPYRGAPYWEKSILQELGLLDKGSPIAIVKNIPEVNAVLWKVKHLIKITPITFPNGEPSEKDIGATYLKENGELLVSKLVEEDKIRLEKAETFANDTSKMDGKTLKKQLRYQWLNPRFNPVN